MTLLLLIFGGICGTIASIIGMGSSMMMAPLLLYVFPYFTGVVLDIETITSTTLALTTFSTSVATWRYHRQKLIPYRFTLLIGAFGSIGSFIGGSFLSQFINHLVVLILFGLVAILSFFFNLIPRIEKEGGPISRHHFFVGFMIIFVLGMITGIIGIGGMALFVPFMIHILGFPLRKTVATTTAVGALISLFGIIGKSMIGHMMWKTALVVAIGGIIGGYIGPSLSKFFPDRYLRYGMNLILLTIIITVLMDIGRSVLH